MQTIDLFFFLLQEKPQATVSEYTMNIYIQRQMRNEHLYVHLTFAAGYFSLFFFFHIFTLFADFVQRDPLKFRSGQKNSTPCDPLVAPQEKEKKKNLFTPGC